MYSIIALDLDGTLTRNDKSISPHTRQTLLDAQQRGLKVVLASGRPTNGMTYIADDLQLSEYGGVVLAYNGGEITDWRTKEVLYRVAFPADRIQHLYDQVKAAGFHIMTYVGREIWTEEVDQYIVRSSERNRMQIRLVDNFVDAVRDVPIAKCMITGDPELLCEFEKRVVDHSDPDIIGYRSEDFYLEFVPKGIDKGRCLQKVLDHYNAKREQLIACGDGYNDLSMIEFAGLGVAMANAKEPLKKAADFITLSNEDDGVAYVVEKFSLI